MEKNKEKKSLTATIFHVILPLLILAGGGVYSYYLLETGPEPTPKKRKARSILVETMELRPASHQVVIEALGQIIPAKELELRSQVGGEIIKKNDEFVPGGYFSKGEHVLNIDPRDYEFVVKQLESEAKKTESDLKVERGNQRIARREFALTGEKLSGEEKDLILRKPQLEKLQAAKYFADARLSKAKLDLERTVVRVPFNGVITRRDVNIGARVSTNMSLGHFVGTDVFWLLVTVPVEQLKWFKIPDNTDEIGSPVKIIQSLDHNSVSARYGKVIRLVPALEELGRMAQLLIEVEDPLCRKDENTKMEKLLLGSYVRAEIGGTSIDASYKIDRAYLHEGRNVWVYKEGKLEIRQVDILFKGKEFVIVQGGVEPGESIITSSISSPVNGLLLRRADLGNETGKGVGEKKNINDKFTRKGSEK